MGYGVLGILTVRVLEELRDNEVSCVRVLVAICFAFGFKRLNEY